MHFEKRVSASWGREGRRGVTEERRLLYSEKRFERKGESGEGGKRGAPRTMGLRVGGREKRGRGGGTGDVGEGKGGKERGEEEEGTNSEHLDGSKNRPAIDKEEASKETKGAMLSLGPATSILSAKNVTREEAGVGIE
jgi:hypothetical protein